jgi:MYXO-CTERM domain-containing protein
MPPAPTPAPSPTKKGSCAIGGAPTAGPSSLLSVTALAVAFLRRRRR